MKKIKSIFKSIPKSVAAVFAMLAAVFVPVAIMAWGPDRPTFTMASPASYITFNSITDNPIAGDERNFVLIKEADNSSATWKDTINLQEGKEYTVRMYVHNNAASNLNLVATNVRASFGLPTASGKAFELNGFVSADNANPTKIWDQVVVNSDREFTLEYVAGTAKYYNTVSGDGGFALGNDLFTSQGALLGYTQMNGQMPGCMEYAGYVLFRIKPEFKPLPSNEFTISKEVRKEGTTAWNNNVTANPGDTLEYRIEYKNTGETTQNNVVIKDALPEGMSYVAGSTKLYNSANPNGLAVSDGIVTASGINVGNYAPGANAVVIFKAKVAENNLLPKCGNNTLKNIASAKPDGQNPKEDDATTVVPKECIPENSDFTMNKKVRVKGQTEWKDNVTARPGDTLEYRINFKNIGNTELKNVVVSDKLPTGVTYVNGSSKLFNDANPNGTAIADGVTTTGVNIGNYAAGKTAAVEFQAKIAANDNLPECGDNTLKNVAKVKPDGENPKEDDANTTVPKDCEKPVKFECEVLTADRNKITKGETVNFTVTPRFTGENVSIKEYKMDFGNTQTQIKDVAQFAYTYDRAGNFVAQAWITYNVDGKTETVTSESCTKPIEVVEPETPPVTPPCPYDPSLSADDPNCVPSYIPATGNGAAAGGIIGAGALTLGIASWLSSRRVLRSLK